MIWQYGLAIDMHGRRLSNILTPVSGRITLVDSVENNTEANEGKIYCHGNPTKSCLPWKSVDVL